MSRVNRRPTVYIHRVEWCPYELYMDKENEALLASFADVRNNGDGRTAMTHEQVVEQLRGADGILFLNGAHAKEITQAALQQAGSVRAASISHWWESFNDMVPGWKAAGVEVIDASDACSEAVAEWTIGAAIAGLRKFDHYDRQMKSGEKWPAWRGVAGQLNGSTFGLVALGRVGRYVLRYLKAFDVRILVHDPGLKPAQAAELGVELVDLDTLLRTADVISLHAPVIPQTRKMIGKRELELIRDGALLLNCARAWLFDNDALRAELFKGRIRAYLDVYEPEPPAEDDILRKLDNVVLTPHVAGTTDKMFLRCGRLAIERLREKLMKLLIILVVSLSPAFLFAAEGTDAFGDPTAALERLQREEQRCEERMQPIQARLDYIRSHTSQGSGLSEEERNKLLRESQMLNESRMVEQIRLNEYREQSRQTQSKQLRAAFGKECDLTLDSGERVHLQFAQLRGMVDVAGRRMLQFEVKNSGLWTIDPARIALVRITTPTDEPKPE